MIPTVEDEVENDRDFPIWKERYPANKRLLKCPTHDLRDRPT